MRAFDPNAKFGVIALFAQACRWRSRVIVSRQSESHIALATPDQCRFRKGALALSAYFGGFADKARRSAFEGRADTEAGISATPAVWRLVGLPMAQTIAVHDSVCGVSQVAFGRSSA
jgi:hypothetical protein